MPNRNQNQGNQSQGNQSNAGRGRGFAGMDADQQRQIASAGGRAAHASGHAHEFTSDEAREAGRKGGEARSQRSRVGTGSSADRDIPQAAGSRGAETGRGSHG